MPSLRSPRSSLLRILREALFIFILIYYIYMPPASDTFQGTSNLGILFQCIIAMNISFLKSRHCCEWQFLPFNRICRSEKVLPTSPWLGCFFVCFFGSIGFHHFQNSRCAPIGKNLTCVWTLHSSVLQGHFLGWWGAGSCWQREALYWRIIPQIFPLIQLVPGRPSALLCNSLVLHYCTLTAVGRDE